MDGFSSASMTSLCSNISHAAVSSSTEIAELLRDISRHEQAEVLIAMHADRLASFDETLLQIHDGSARLEGMVSNASVISEKLRTQMAENLDDCHGKMAVLNKALMRLEPGNLAKLNVAFTAAYDNLLTTYIRLFIYFGELLAMRTRAEQDAALEDSNVRAVIEKTNLTLQMLSSAEGILSDDPRSAPAVRSPITPTPSGGLADDDLPPPYEAMEAPPQAGPSSGAFDDALASSNSCRPGDGESPWSLASLKDSLFALTAPLRPKPDPLVSALCQASARGDMQQIAAFLQQDANVDGRNEDGHTPLHCAVANNRVDAARLLLSSGASENNCHKMPALFVAAANGHIEMAKMLLARAGSGATKAVRRENVSGQPYFVEVVASGSLEGVRFLLENGAKARSSTTSGRPCIVHACRKNDVEMVRLLLDHGAKVKTDDITGAALLSVAIDKAGPEMVSLLLERGASPDAKNVSGEYVLAGVISRRDMRYARMLLDHGASGSIRNIYGQRIIIEVVRDTQLPERDKADLVRRLLERGASAKAKDIYREAPILQQAIDKAGGEVVSLLLKHGADGSCIVNGSDTLLTYAINNGKHDHLHALLKHGIDAESEDKRGRTPLMTAVMKQDLVAVRMLRSFGAKVTEGPRNFAEVLKRPEILEALGIAPAAAGVSAHDPGDAPPGYETVDRLKN